MWRRRRRMSETRWTVVAVLVSGESGFTGQLIEVGDLPVQLAQEIRGQIPASPPVSAGRLSDVLRQLATHQARDEARAEGISRLRRALEARE